MDNWHGVEHHSWNLVSNGGILSVPPCAIHEEAMNVNAIFRCLFDLFWTFSIEELEGVCESINCDPVLSGVCLEYTCHEALWEEHTWKPVGGWVPVCQPLREECHSDEEVLVP